MTKPLFTFRDALPWAALTALGIPAGVNGENHHRIFAEEGLGA